MTRAELIRELQARGIDRVYGRALSRATKAELEQAWRTLSEGQISPHLSLSQVRMYLRCGLQYWYRYVEGRKIPPRGSMVVGRAVHRALEHDFKTCLLEGLHEPVDVLADVYFETFKSEAEEAIWDSEKPEEAFKTGLLVLEEFARGPMETIVPEAVEEQFEVPLTHGMNLKGVIDLIEAREGILDHKVVTRRMRPEDVVNDLQLAVYSHAKGIERVGMNTLVRKKKPEIQLFRHVVSGGQRNRVLNIFLYVVEGIWKRVFLPAPPGSWWCSPTWCGYWDLCHEELSTH